MGAATLVAPGIAQAHDAFSVSAARLTTAAPKLDGVMQPGEWASATTFTFDGVADNGQVWVMHDETDVYVAFRRIEPSPGTIARFQVYFDNGHDGTLTTGDDGWSVGVQPATGGVEIVDGYYNGAAGFPVDTSDGATNETSGGATYTAGTNELVYEMKHPRCTGDVGHDVCIPLAGAAPIGATFFFVRDGNRETAIFRPAAHDDQANFGHLTLAAGGGAAANGKIAFSSSRDGDLDIYTLDLATGAVAQLTNEAGEDLSASYRADGSRIAFQSQRDGDPEIFVMDANGSNVVQLTNNTVFDGFPAFSPDGQTISFRSDRDGSADLWLMNADGTNPRKLASAQGTSHWHSTWSPDGQTIAFQRREANGNDEIYTVPAAGGAATNITNTPTGAIEERPNWSNDGASILFDIVGSEVNDGIWRMSPDGTGRVRLTTSGIRGDFSPDGTKIVFETIGAAELMTASALDGSAQTNITNNAADDVDPDWAPAVAGPPGLVVTNTNDGGAGSLRQAILDANADPESADTITFAIPGSGPHVIAPATPLPSINGTTTIDGTTQPGYVGPPVIGIDGGGSGNTGLSVVGGNSAIRGVAVYGWGNAIYLEGGNNSVAGSYVGIDPNGVVRGNGNTGILVNDGSATIGGATAADRNVISGNFNGVIASTHSFPVIRGNYVGTTPNGLGDAGNSANGVLINPGATGVVVDANVLSGNNGDGIHVHGPSNTITGNLVGLAAKGESALGNGGDGIQINGSGNTVGGVGEAARNVVSGNAGHGIFLFGSFDATVLGNYAGTNAAGTAAVPNGVDGIAADGGSEHVIRGNLASGNRNQGIAIFGVAFASTIGITIQGNRAGTNAEGSAAVPNGGDGIRLFRARDTVVGGTGDGEPNVASGNGGNGVAIYESSSVRNTVSGNLIGTAADGFEPLGNGRAGVLLTSGTTLNTVGPANVIAFNGTDTRVATGKAGVLVTGAATGLNRITQNAVYDNTGLGIDLADDGPTRNDGAGDADTGPNDLQNAPVLTQAVLEAGSDSTALVSGELVSAQGDNYTIEFFASSTCDRAGAGEGARLLATLVVNIAESDTIPITNVPVGGVEPNEVVTATATAHNFDVDAGSEPETSEFSNCVTVGGNAVVGQLALTVDERSVGAGASLVPLQSVPGSFYGLAAGAVAPIPNSPIPNSPIPNSPIPNSGFDGIPLSILESVLLSSIPLNWDEIFAGTSYAGLPPQSLTLRDVFTDPTALGRFRQHTIGELRLEGTLLRGARFVSLIFGGTKLKHIPPYTQSGWCAKLPSCTGVDVDVTTVLGLDVAGLLGFAGLGDVRISQITDPGPAVAPIPNSTIPYTPIPNSPIPNSPIPNSPIPNSPIPNSAFTLTSVGSIKIADLREPANVVDCTKISCAASAGKTLHDAFAAGAVLPTGRFVDLLLPKTDGGTSPMASVKLSEFVVAFAGIENLPWESWPIDGFQEFSGTGASVHYHLNATVGCDAPYTLRVTLPHGFMVKRGTSRLVVGTAAATSAPDPQTDPKTGAAWSLPALACATPQPVRLDFEALPGFRLGSHTATARLASGGTTATATGQAPVDVTENDEPDDDSATAPVMAKDTLVIGHVAAANNVDFRRFAIPSGGRGTRVMVFLNPPPGTDLDLYLSKPPSQTMLASPIPNSPIPNSPIPNSPLPDNGGSLSRPLVDLQPEGLQDAPIPNSEVSSSSIQRGDDTEVAQVVLNGDEQGHIRIAVAGYNGAESNDPYTLRVKVIAPPALPACNARTPASVAGTLPPGVAPGTQTLFLMNYGATVQAFGTTKADELVAKLEEVAARSDVNGAVIQVDGDISVRNAKAAWDQQPCSPEAANDVVRKINALVAGYRGAAPIRYVVVVGSDELMPMARVPDLTTDANEADAATDLLFTTQGFQNGNALFASMYLGNVLTDAPYFAATTIPWFGRELYLDEVAGGRLVETADEIIGQLDQYIAANGLLSPQTALVTGYDFMKDQATAAKADLEARGATVDSSLTSTTPPFIGDTWTKADVAGYYSDPALKRDVLAVNGHYNHWQLAPAAPTPLGTADLVPTSVLPAFGSSAPQFPKGILFTIGCHAGLNVPDVYPDGSTPERLRDWAQALAQNQTAVYVANTGYGYGSYTAIALSERLLTLFSSELRTSGVVGEKFLAAKQNYFLGVANYDPYAEKALVEATLYGLPFYRVNSPTPPTTATVTPVADPTGVSAAAFTFTPSLTRHDTDRGSYWAPPSGDVEFLKDRPVQPRISQPVTAGDGLRAHGVRITALETHDEGGVNLVIAKPTIDLGAHEPEPRVRETIFPANFVSVNRTNRFGEPHDTLVLVPGQSRPAAGNLHDERLVDRISVEVLYSTSSDFKAPRFLQVGSIVNGGTATLFAVTKDDAPGQVQKVTAFFTEGDAVWRFVELDRVGTSNTYVKTGVPVSAAVIQAGFWSQDDAGNVGYTMDKGFLFISKRGDSTGPEIDIFSPRELQTVLLNQPLTTSYACSDDGGVAACTGLQGTTAVPSGGSIDTSTVGEKTVTVEASDISGNPGGPLVRTYRVVWNFDGFYEPINNLPTVNRVKAGSGVPLKFSLGGFQGLDIFAPASPTSVKVACDGSAPLDLLDETVSAGSSTLSYDTATDRYRYVWKTERTWANTCRKLVIRFKDGTERSALFSFTK